MNVVTAIISNTFHHAETAEQVEELVDEALSGRHWRLLSQFYVSDRPCGEGDGDLAGRHYPDHRFSIITSEDGAHAAAHFVPPGVSEPVVQSLNTRSPNGPQLIFDSEGGVVFPANAAVSPAEVKAAALEYCRTSALPTSLTWQPSTCF